jgi:hypothetical protein
MESDRAARSAVTTFFEKVVTGSGWELSSILEEAL